MRIQNYDNIQTRTNFTGVTIYHKAASKDLQRFNKPIQEFINNKKNQQLVNILEKRYGADCLIVPTEKNVIIQIGKQESEKIFKLFYVSSTLENFIKDARKIVSRITDPEYLAAQRSRASFREACRTGGKGFAIHAGDGVWW